MAKKLAKFDFPNHGAGRSKYPLDEWFNGSIWKLTRGEDYTITTAHMRSVLYTAARNRGLRLMSSIQDDGNSIVISVYKPEQ
jgi:hypothetical protein